MMRQHLHIVAPDIDAAADVAWFRAQVALRTLSISDILSAVDDLVSILIK
jgi:hypothetical protein